MTGAEKIVLKSKTRLIRNIVFIILLVYSFSFWINIPKAQGEEIYIISNASLQISFEDIKNAYLGKISKVDGEKLIILEPPAENPVKQKFLQNVLGIDIQSYRKIWLTKLMAGETPPQVKSEDEIIKEVSERKFAIGYTSKKIENEHIKVIKLVK